MLAGHSLGGLLAAHVAEHHPDQVAHLVLIGAGFVHPEGNEDVYAHLATALAIAEGIDSQDGPVSELIDEVAWLLEDATASAHIERNTARQFAFRLLDCVDTAPRLTDPAWAAPRPPHEMPLTAIWGWHDSWVPLTTGLSIGAFGTTEAGPRHLFLLTDSGHLPHLEQAEDLAQVLAAHVQPGQLAELPSCLGEGYVDPASVDEATYQALGGSLPAECLPPPPPPPPTPEGDLAGWLEHTRTQLVAEIDNPLSCQRGFEAWEKWAHGALHPSAMAHCDGSYRGPRVHLPSPARMDRADFTGTDLRRLQQLVAREAVFERASLYDVERADLSSAVLREASLDGRWDRVILSGADLSGADLGGDWSRVLLDDVRMDEAYLDRLTGSRLVFTGSSLVGAELDDFACWGCVFAGLDLDGLGLAQLGEDNLFVDTSLRQADLSRATGWYGTRMVRVDLTGASIASHEGDEIASFDDNAFLVDVICPDGHPGADGVGGCRGHLTPQGER